MELPAEYSRMSFKRAFNERPYGFAGEHRVVAPTAPYAVGEGLAPPAKYPQMAFEGRSILPTLVEYWRRALLADIFIMEKHHPFITRYSRSVHLRTSSGVLKYPKPRRTVPPLSSVPSVLCARGAQ